MRPSLFALLAGLLIGVMTMLACSHGRDRAAPPRRESAVVFESDGRTIRVLVEVARTAEETRQGLMYRRELPALSGMLFIFASQEVQSFWMKNTYIPLDMIFIDEKLVVVGAVENAEPLTLGSRRVEAPSRYVLEVNAGFTRRHGIKPGARIRFEGVDGP